jgi:hypothetical protein
MKDTIDMARESGFTEREAHKNHGCIERLIALVRADEREACASECDELASFLFCHRDKDGAEICRGLRDSIRARGIK